jgi:hypothetical protein
MTSFVNMFSPAPYTCNDIRAVGKFRAQFRVSRLWPIGAVAAAVVQVTGINKGTYTHIYQ